MLKNNKKGENKMDEDKNYQLYVNAKKKLVKERLAQAKEYLATQFHGVSIIVYEDTGEIRFATIDRCECFGTAFLMPAGRVNACLPYDFFMSQLKHKVKVVIDRVNERNQQYVKFKKYI